MVAGPNGSGKSTIVKGVIQPSWLGVWVNADEIDAALHGPGWRFPEGIEGRSLAEMNARLTADERTAPFADARLETNSAGGLITPSVTHGSYVSAILADVVREECLRKGISFTFETVMSHRSKLDLIIRAREFGFRTYLYFVATDSPVINIDRVRNRVRDGGHSVPENKIPERYERTLALLPRAIASFDRSFIFDNSAADRNAKFIAEYELLDGSPSVVSMEDEVPGWFVPTYRAL